MTSRNVPTRLLALAAASALATPASAQWIQDRIFRPDDGFAAEAGFAVALSGSRGLVGVPGDDEQLSNSGSVRVVDLDGNELMKLQASDPGTNDRFGHALALSGDTALIGAHSNNDAGTNSGSAYLVDVSTGVEMHKLVADDAASFDQFGIAVATNGSAAVVGANRDVQGGANTGSVYVFEVSTGLQTRKLNASDAANGDLFGSAVAISGTRVVVGAPGDDDNGPDSGSVYVIDWTTETELLKLTPSDGTEGDFFGNSIAVSGSTAVIGAVKDGTNGESSGSAYVFNIVTGQQIAKLLPADGGNEDGEFGHSVAIYEDTVVVGSRIDDGKVVQGGAVFVYSAGGVELQKIELVCGFLNDFFGSGVAVNSSRILAGAALDDDVSQGSGAAYTFTEGLPHGVSTFGSGCHGLSISAAGSPQVAGCIEPSLSGAPAGAAAFVIVGISTTLWDTVPLPADLASLGAPGCTLYTNIFDTVDTVANAAGDAAVTIPVPSTAPVGGTVYMQWGVFSPGINGLNLAFSDAMNVTIQDF